MSTEGRNDLAQAGATAGIRTLGGRCRWVGAGSLVLAFLGSALAGQAQLAWDSRVVEIKAQPGDAKGTAVFRFRNGGANPVQVTGLKTSCGCTAAETGRRRYLGGEGGELTAVVDFEGAVGRFERTVTVVTDDRPEEPTVLTIRVEVPELFQYSSRLLMWRAGEEPAEKTVIIAAARRLDSLEVGTVDRSLVEVGVVAVEPGRRYRVTVRPRSTQVACTVPVGLLAVVDGSRRYTPTLFLLVR